MDGGDGDAAVLAGPDLLGVQAGGVLEEAGQRGAGADLVGEGLGGAAQRAQVLEHAFAVAALVGARRAVAARLVVGDEAAVERERGDDDVPERAAGAVLVADGLQSGAEGGQRCAGRRRADVGELVARWRWR